MSKEEMFFVGFMLGVTSCLLLSAWLLRGIKRKLEKTLDEIKRSF